MWLSLRAASQIYWNGVPLASNGVVGRSPSDEHPGLIDIIRSLPPVPSTSTSTSELLVLASSQQQWLDFHSAGVDILIAPIETI